MKLTLEEQETIILYDNGSSAAEVYTHHRSLIKSLEKKCQAYPDIFEKKCDNGQGGITFVFPKKYVRISSPRKSAI